MNTEQQKYSKIKLLLSIGIYVLFFVGVPPQTTFGEATEVFNIKDSIPEVQIAGAVKVGFHSGIGKRAPKEVCYSLQVRNLDQTDSTDDADFNLLGCRDQNSAGFSCSLKGVLHGTDTDPPTGYATNDGQNCPVYSTSTNISVSGETSDSISFNNVHLAILGMHSRVKVEFKFVEYPQNKIQYRPIRFTSIPAGMHTPPNTNKKYIGSGSKSNGNPMSKKIHKIITNEGLLNSFKSNYPIEATLLLPIKHFLMNASISYNEEVLFEEGICSVWTESSTWATCVKESGENFNLGSVENDSIDYLEEFVSYFGPYLNTKIESITGQNPKNSNSFYEDYLKNLKITLSKGNFDSSLLSQANEQYEYLIEFQSGTDSSYITFFIDEAATAEKIKVMYRDGEKVIDPEVIFERSTETKEMVILTRSNDVSSGHALRSNHPRYILDSFGNDMYIVQNLENGKSSYDKIIYKNEDNGFIRIKKIDDHLLSGTESGDGEFNKITYSESLINKSNDVGVHTNYEISFETSVTNRSLVSGYVRSDDTSIVGHSEVQKVIETRTIINNTTSDTSTKTYFFGAPMDGDSLPAVEEGRYYPFSQINKTLYSVTNVTDGGTLNDGTSLNISAGGGTTISFSNVFNLTPIVAGTSISKSTLFNDGSMVHYNRPLTFRIYGTKNSFRTLPKYHTFKLLPPTPSSAIKEFTAYQELAPDQALALQAKYKYNPISSSQRLTPTSSNTTIPAGNTYNYTDITYDYSSDFDIIGYLPDWIIYRYKAGSGGWGNETKWRAKQFIHDSKVDKVTHVLYSFLYMCTSKESRQRMISPDHLGTVDHMAFSRAAHANICQSTNTSPYSQTKRYSNILSSGISPSVIDVAASSFTHYTHPTDWITDFYAGPALDWRLRKLSDGELVPVDATKKWTILSPDRPVLSLNTTDGGGFFMIESVKEIIANSPHTMKFIPSLGGWNYSAMFWDIFNSPNPTATLNIVASNIADYVELVGADGIDIDWEFPGVGNADLGIVGDPVADKTNFVTFIAAVYNAFQTKFGPANDKEISIAIATFDKALEAMNFTSLNSYVDKFHLMTYDYLGPWGYTGHQSNLYSDSSTKAQNYEVNKWSIDHAVTQLNAAGVPKNKMVPGVAFYGRSWRGIHVPNYSKATVNSNLNSLFYKLGSGAGGGETQSGIYPYKFIKHVLKPESTPINVTYDKFYDATLGGCILYSPQRQEFISYDCPEVVEQKAAYVKDNQLGGVIIWELSQDDGDLMEAIYKGYDIIP